MTFDEAIIAWAAGKVPEGSKIMDVEHGMTRGYGGCDTCGYGGTDDEVYVTIRYTEPGDDSDYPYIRGVDVEGETLTSLLRALFEASGEKAQEVTP